MVFLNDLFRKSLRPKVIQRLFIRRKGHGNHGPMMPPFARLKPPQVGEQIPEETELVWDDSVAPETCIDFDAPHVSTNVALLSFLAAFGFFGVIFSLVTLSDPIKNNPVAPRSAVVSMESFQYSIGLGSKDTDEE